MIRIGLWLMAPIERWWEWQFNRAYAKGKYLRPTEEKPCVTTARPKELV